MAEAGAEIEPVEGGAKKERWKPDEEDLLFLEDLGLPEMTASQTTVLDGILTSIRTARSNPHLRAIFLAHKGLNQPGVLQGKERTIKFVQVEAAKQTLAAVAKPLREQGYRVIPYAKGYLVEIRGDDD